MRSRRTLLAVLLSAVALVFVGGRALAGEPQDKRVYDLYVTCSQGADQKAVTQIEVVVTALDQGPVAGAVPFTRKTDDEGIATFHLTHPGRYRIDINDHRYASFTKVAELPADGEAVYVEADLKPSAARIRVTVADGPSGKPIEGADVETQRSDKSLPDHMATDSGGVAYVLIDQSEAQGGLDYRVTVRHDDYVSQIQHAKADNDKTSEIELRFDMRRESATKLLTVAAYEDGPHAAILGARVVVDGGGSRLFVRSTGPDGEANFLLPPGFKYAVQITTDHFEDDSKSVDMTGGDVPDSQTLEFDLLRKSGDADNRRGLIVFVRYLDQDRKAQPVEGATVDGPGQHDGVTGSDGVMVFLHKEPPGENITVSARRNGFRPKSASVLVKDKGILIDVKKFNRDTAGGTSALDAIVNQGAGAYETVTIILEKGDETEVKVTGRILAAKSRVNLNDDIHCSVNLTYESGNPDDIDVDENVVIYGPKGNVIDDNSGVRRLHRGTVSERQMPVLGGSLRGAYRITSKATYTTEDPATGNTVKKVLWTGETTVVVSDDSPDITVTGDVVPSKGRVKLDERVDVGVNLLYEQGPTDTMSFNETVELFDPSGAVVQNNFSSRSMTRKDYSKRNFAITCQQSGTYRLKSVLKTGDGKQVWTGEAKFDVTKDGAAVTQKPGQGYYKLKNKVIGSAPGPQPGPYGTWSGSMGESSFSASYEGSGGYDSHASLSAQWSTPPAIIKVDDPIDLTATVSASVTGKDKANIGLSAYWSIDGSVTVLESSNAFAGISERTGQLVGSGTGKYKFKAGSGGSLTISSGHAGASWGSSDNWTPCKYEYEWVANEAPPADGAGKKTTMTAGGG